jgi:hypothetical protein
LADDHHDPADKFLEGPLFKKARPPQIYLETYDSAWRAGAQAIGYREAAELLIDVVCFIQFYSSTDTVSNSG